MTRQIFKNRWFIWTIVSIIIIGFGVWGAVEYTNISMDTELLQNTSSFKFIELKSYIKIISPNGGETWKVNESYYIKWQGEGLEKWGDVVTMCLSTFDSKGNENEAKEEGNSICYWMHGHEYLINEATLSKKEFGWAIPENIFERFIPSPTLEEPSFYKISVSVFDHLPVEDGAKWTGRLIADDESDGYFRIISE